MKNKFISFIGKRIKKHCGLILGLILAFLLIVSNIPKTKAVVVSTLTINSATTDMEIDNWLGNKKLMITPYYMPNFSDYVQITSIRILKSTTYSNLDLNAIFVCNFGYQGAIPSTSELSCFFNIKYDYTGAKIVTIGTTTTGYKNTLTYGPISEYFRYNTTISLLFASTSSRTDINATLFFYEVQAKSFLKALRNTFGDKEVFELRALGTDNTDGSYSDGFEEGYQAGRDEGYSIGVNDGYSIGYNAGLEAGSGGGSYEEGWEAGQQYGWEQGYNYGRDAGYTLGYNAGLEEASGLYTLGYNEGKIDGYIEGFEEGLKENDVEWWYDEGLAEGIRLGYDTGYNDGFAEGKATNLGYQEGYNEGYTKGQNDTFSFITIIGHIVSVFYSAFFTILSFEVFGIRLWQILLIPALMGVLLLVWKVIKG